MTAAPARLWVLAGTAAAVLSLGLPWRAVAGLPGYVTPGYYAPGYCDVYDGYCDPDIYVPGYYVPGLPGGTYPGAQTDARFFIVAAVVLALWGLYPGHRRAQRWAAYVALAGVALYLTYGLTGGIVTLAVAAGCFWWAWRRSPVPC